MKNKFMIFLSILMPLLLSGCGHMDETYREFTEDDKVYLGMIRNPIVYPGEQRVRISWNKLTDPRTEKIIVEWSNGTGTFEKLIENKSDTTLVIEPLAEGSYVFSLYASDIDGNRSLKTDVPGEVYGEYYRSTLQDRLIKKVTPVSEGIEIEFYQSADTSFIYQEVIYKSATSPDSVKIKMEATDDLIIQIPDYEGESFKTISYFNPNKIDFDIFASYPTVKLTPSTPLQVLPQDNSANISCCPTFKWVPMLGVETLYKIMISDDNGATWKEFTTSDEDSYTMTKSLSENTAYQWKVVAAGVESPVFSFETGKKDIYGDGELKKIQESAKPQASNIVFVGEGFLQNDYKTDGIYDHAVSEAYETLFGVEPYKTYKEYFNVYSICPYASVKGIADVESTVFRTEYDNDNKQFACDQNSVAALLKESFPEFEDSDFANTSVVIIVNADIGYSNTMYAKYDKQFEYSISFCPMHRNFDDIPYSELKYYVVKECGGYGYGLLASEFSSISGEITEQARTELLKLQESGKAMNLVIAGSEAPWKDFIGKDGYTGVGMCEGGFGYEKGVNRSEENSAMSESAIPYFNIGSRLAIVKRILQIAGEPFDMEQFKSKDSTDQNLSL